MSAVDSVQDLGEGTAEQQAAEVMGDLGGLFSRLGYRVVPEHGSWFQWAAHTDVAWERRRM